MAVLQINQFLAIPLDEFEFELSRSGGPGGQNVNKVNSKTQLRWKPSATSSLPEPVKARLIALVANRLTVEGELLIASTRTRDQLQNREDCLSKLRAIILTAVVPPKTRRATKPTKASRTRRIESKVRRSTTRRDRQVPEHD